jgi:hypothetical protein
MAYDDSSSIFNFGDWAQLETTLDRYLTLPENISVARLREALGALSKVSQGGQAAHLTVADAAKTLQASQLGHLPISMVHGLLNAVGQHGAEASDKLTLKQLDDILARAKQP